MITPVMTYVSEYWPIKNQYMHKMEVAEMRMLRWMCGETKNAKIKNGRFLKHLEVASIEDKIRKPI